MGKVYRKRLLILQSGWTENWKLLNNVCINGTKVHLDSLSFYLFDLSIHKYDWAVNIGKSFIETLNLSEKNYILYTLSELLSDETTHKTECTESRIHRTL